MRVKLKKRSVFRCVEIRQEAVKAALAMYSNQKQAVIVSSKRNTNYLVPTSMASNPSGSGGLHQENPFPVDHITGGKLINTSTLSTGNFLFCSAFTLFLLIVLLRTN